MNLKETTRELNNFAKNVIKISKENLKKRGYKGKSKNVTGGLERSLSYNLKVSPNSFQLQFLYNDYGEYVDAGVDGVKKRHGQRKYKLPTFKYKSGGGKQGLKGMPPTSSILKWVNKRGLRLRNKETGQFMKGGQQSLAFVIARSIFQKGFKPSYFFSDAFDKAFKKIDKKLIEKYALDVEAFLDYTLPTK